MVHVNRKIQRREEEATKSKVSLKQLVSHSRFKAKFAGPALSVKGIEKYYGPSVISNNP